MSLRFAAASLVAMGLAWATISRADELPLPATPPVTSDPVAKTNVVPPVGVSRPLWELGLGAAVLRLPDYLGSDQSTTYALPLPYVVYRGKFLRADRDGARAIFFAGKRIEVDLSVAASIPVRSKDSDARQGMPDLPGSFEIGPNVNVALFEGVGGKVKVDLRLPIREAITLQRSPSGIGLTFSPSLAIDLRRLVGDWNIGMLTGPQFANRHYDQHFYGVGTEFARADRPAYEAPGGYGGWRAVVATSRRIGNAWVGAFVRYDDLHGAAFAPSPLVRRERNVTGGIGVSWVFATSSQRVVTDD